MLRIREAGFGVLFRVKRSIDFAEKFLLVDNTIDGFVTIDIEEFHNFEDLNQDYQRCYTLLNVQVSGTLNCFKSPNPIE